MATTTTAQDAFDALTDEQKVALAGELFNTLEYTKDGIPGREFNADTSMDLDQVFRRYGVELTEPEV